MGSGCVVFLPADYADGRRWGMLFFGIEDLDEDRG